MAPQVVIVGGGFGGLSAARALRGAQVRVTLIDKRNYHLFRPMLYQVATGLLSGDEIAGPLRSILSRQSNADVLLDEVTGVDPAQRVVHLRQRELPYDFLILATGIKYNYFGHDEWHAFAPGLESLGDADVIRGKILLAFERAEALAAASQAQGQVPTDEIRRLLTFVLVGAGTVGVEMAGTLAEMSRMSLAHDFRHIDPKSARILLYEAAPRILPTYPESLSLKAQHHLESLGVKVFTNTRVTSVDADGIVVGGERVPAATVLWGAGVVASPAGRWLGTETDKSGRIMVQPDLSVRDHPEIFAIGDTAHVVAPARNLFGIKSRTPMLLPGVAQPAIQEGRYVADVIRRRVAGRPQPKPFWYWDKGDLAIVGRTYAVADLHFSRFAGFPAWLLWAGVHIYFLIGFANRLFVLLQWGLAFLTKRRRVRILPGEPPSASELDLFNNVISAKDPSEYKRPSLPDSSDRNQGDNMRIVVIGGTGLIGSRLVNQLREHGHDAVAAAPNTGVNTLTGEGLAEALKSASVVVDVSNSPSWDDEAVLNFFETSTRNLLAYEARAGVRHHIALSVVGTQQLSESGYFRAKIAQENLIKESSIPYTIVHATQFFEFLKGLADISMVGDEVHLPPVLFQPMAADDVASALARIAVGSPKNGIVEIGGPEQFRLDELVRRRLASLKDPREVIADPNARYSGAKLSERTLVPGEGALLGATTFESWLAQSAAQMQKTKSPAA